MILKQIHSSHMNIHTSKKNVGFFIYDIKALLEVARNHSEVNYVSSENSANSFILNGGECLSFFYFILKYR